ncbi:MAG: hypothetical protein Q9187_002686 [Circinaria calcarea]
MAPPFLLSFLYPRPPPRLSLIRSCLRTISTTRPLRQEEKANPDIVYSASAITAPPQPQGPSQGTSSVLLTYHVNRTPSQQLPVYHLAKRGGNLKQTRIRKISGDVASLRQDLQQALGLREEHIVINQLTKHIIIKGWKKTEVAKFLQEKRF